MSGGGGSEGGVNGGEETRIGRGKGGRVDGEA